MPLWQHVLVGDRLLRPVRVTTTATGARRSRQPRAGAARPGASDARSSGMAARAAARRGRRAASAGRSRRRAGADVHRAARPRRAAAGDHLHLQPGRLRRRRAAVPALRAAADHAPRRRDEIRAHRRGAHAPTSPTRTSACSATGSGSRAWSAGSPRTTPACCRRSRRSSRSCSPAGWSRRSSPPRRWRSASTCRPARVVLEKLVKWNGETHADVTPGEYTQLTGRAGRRGIDVEGHAVVLWQPGVDPAAVAGLASTRTYPLRSSFRPTYNMAVNLVGQVGRERAREILETSFAQFQADRAVVGLARQVAPQRGGARRATREAMTCHLGDFSEYAGAAAARSRTARPSCRARPSGAHRAAGRGVAWRSCGSGDVIRVPAGRRAGFAVVVDPGTAAAWTGRGPTVLTADRQVRRLSLQDVPGPGRAAHPGPRPQDFNARKPAVAPRPRLDAAHAPGRRRRPAGRAPRPLAGGGRRPSSRGCGAGCAPTRATAAPTARTTPAGRERWWRLRARDRRSSRGGSRAAPTPIARTFDRVCDAAHRAAATSTGDTVTLEGRRLSRLYAEPDLLAAECLREGRLGGPRRAGAGRVRCRRWSTSRAATTAASPRGSRRAGRGGAGRDGAAVGRLEEREHDHRLSTHARARPRAGLGHASVGGRGAAGRGARGRRPRRRRLRPPVQAADRPARPDRARGRRERGRRSAPRAAKDAVDGVRRGVVAYSSVV